MARTREVFPTEEIPYKWAHQAQAFARNPQGNFRFTGNVITSYSTDIAQIHRHKTRGALVLISEHRYSNTTARQLRHIAQAVRHMRSIDVPEPCPKSYAMKEAHAKNLTFLLAISADSLAKAQRAQTGHSVRWLNGKGAQALKDVQTYSEFFGIRRKVPAFPADAWQAAVDRVQTIENPSLEEIARRERQRAAREAREEITGTPREQKRQAVYAARRLAEIARECSETARAEFLNAGCHRSAWRLGSENATLAREGAIMLRVKGEEIQTSHGACIPLAAAPMVWQMVKCAIRKGVYVPEGLARRKVGDYVIDGIDADGALHVGCHEIPHSELRSMARLLKLEGAR